MHENIFSEISKAIKYIKLVKYKKYTFPQNNQISIKKIHIQK